MTAIAADTKRSLAEAGREWLRGLPGYLLIVGWAVLMSLVVDVVSGGRTYPVSGGPDAFSRAVGGAWIGSLVLFVIRDLRSAHTSTCQ